MRRRWCLGRTRTCVGRSLLRAWVVAGAVRVGVRGDLDAITESVAVGVRLGGIRFPLFDLGAVTERVTVRVLTLGVGVVLVDLVWVTQTVTVCVRLLRVGAEVVLGVVRGPSPSASPRSLGGGAPCAGAHTEAKASNAEPVAAAMRARNRRVVIGIDMIRS